MLSQLLSSWFSFSQKKICINEDYSYNNYTFYSVLKIKMKNMSYFYELSAKNITGQEVNFSDYKDKLVIVVNTASKCGLTPQYEWLEKLYQKYQEKGLVILGFPCNQFANQESGDEKSIQQWCLLNYGVTFPMFAKVDVNGKNAHPVFAYLTDKLRGFLWSKKVKWNFTKFVVGKDWTPLKRFAPTFKPEDMETFILKHL